jgi:hypothetical protein
MVPGRSGRALGGFVEIRRVLGVRNGRVGGLKGVRTPPIEEPTMVRQGFKQDARRRVTEALSAQRKERLEQERRLADLAVQILAAIAERDEAVHSAEQQAADAVRALLAGRLSVAEIADLCGGQVDVKELTRLSRIPPVPANASGVKS